MRFEYPIYLLLILVVPLLVLLYRHVVKWKQETAHRIGDARLIDQLIKSYSPKRFRIKFFLMSGGLLLIVIGLANLQDAKKVEAVSRKGMDILIALDVSKSMLTQDVQPDRLQRSKILINELIKSRQDDRFGLLLFAGHPYLQMPLSTDFSSLSMYVESASPEAVPTQGTQLAEALHSARLVFDRSDKKYKAIVLISDGENHEEEAAQAAKDLADEGVVVYAIGVGTSSGKPFIDPETNKPKITKDGIPVVSKLNEQLLQELATQTGGSYFFLTDVQAVAKRISTAMEGLGKKEIKDKSLLQYNSYFPWFLWAALLLLLIEFFLSEKKQIQ